MTENNKEGSESYWKKRCEAAEKLMQFQCYDSTNPCNDFKEYHDAGILWQQLKSSIGEETEGQDELWSEIFKELYVEIGDAEYPSVLAELKSKYTLIKKQ